MKQIRPRDMTQGAFAELLKGAGFEACSKTAVSLAERPDVSGVQFTRAARETAQELLNLAREGKEECGQVARATENRVNGRKTTVWFDDATRAWLEQRAYMEDSNVGEIIRQAVSAYRTAWARIEEARKPKEVRPASVFFDAMDKVFGHEETV